MDKQYQINGKEHKIKIGKSDANHLEFEIDGQKYSYQLVGRIDDYYFLTDGARVFKAALNRENRICLENVEVEVEVQSRKGSNKAIAGELKSPMPGKIFKILAKVDQKVKIGDPLIIVEAMKMEHTIKANQDGVVKKIFFKEGQQVENGALLVQIEASSV